jgi:histidinol-phosphate aminotransferase
MGDREVVRLHQNEAPEDWPEQVKLDVAERLVAAAWHRYPPARADAACEAIARLQGTPPSMIAATAGSNEALWAVFAACAAGGTVVTPSPTYSMARTLATAAGARVVDVPLADGFALDPDAMLRAAHARRAELVYLASPNNPTGNALDRDAVRAVIAGAPGAVMVDEAYWEFASGSWLDALDRHGRLIIVRTFSKAMGGAGLRVGWLTAQPPVIAELIKVIPPYSLNVLAQAAVPALVAHRHLAAARVRVIVTERARMAAAMRGLGMTVYPSETNFLLFEPGGSPTDAWRALAERGVLVRDVSGVPRLRACLRVSVGAPVDNDRFLAALAAYAGERR